MYSRTRVITVRVLQLAFIQLINFQQTNLVAAFQERDQMFDLGYGLCSVCEYGR